MNGTLLWRNVSRGCALTDVPRHCVCVPAWIVSSRDRLQGENDASNSAGPTGGMDKAGGGGADHGAAVCLRRGRGDRRQDPEQVPHQPAARQFITAYAREKGVATQAVAATDPLPCRAVCWCWRFVMPCPRDNAFLGHHKSTSVRGALYQDGRAVASSRAVATRWAASPPGYWGSCSVLGRTVKALGQDIASGCQPRPTGRSWGDLKWRTALARMGPVRQGDHDGSIFPNWFQPLLHDCRMGAITGMVELYGFSPTTCRSPENRPCGAPAKRRGTDLQRTASTGRAPT